MTKLESVVQDLDSQFKSKFPGKTIKEQAADVLVNNILAQSFVAQKESERHRFAMVQIQRRQENLNKAMQILMGSKGYLRCSQGQLNIQDGFTAFEEITGRLMESFVDVYFEVPACGFGMEVWAIDDKGMMTLVDSKVDSSD